MLRVADGTVAVCFRRFSSEPTYPKRASEFDIQRVATFYILIPAVIVLSSTKNEYQGLLVLFLCTGILYFSTVSHDWLVYIFKHCENHYVSLRTIYLSFPKGRSPWWSSGCPRMLLLVVLVLKLESRRGELESVCKKEEKDQLLRAPSVGRHNSTRVGEGRAEIFSR